jgi:hypothetical protein
VRNVRHHLLSLAAVLLAVGAGLVWGSGPITGQMHATVETQTRRLSSEQQALKAEIAQLKEGARLGEAFVSTVSGPLAAGRLPDRRVAIFVAPGADADLVKGVGNALSRAGASITNTISLTADYVDPTKAASPLEDLALQLIPPNVTFPAGASSIDRVSTVLARSTVTSVPDGAGRQDDEGAAVLAGFEEIGALRLAGNPGTLAELGVLVVGPPSAAMGGADNGSASTQALAGLAAAVDRGGRGLVVIGPKSSAGRSGVIAMLRHPSGRDEANGSAVSTVDLGDTSIGPLAVVLALAENLRGKSGHYGVARGAPKLLPPAS